MNTYPYRFLSPLFARVNKLKSSGDLSKRVPDCAIIGANPCDDIMPKISTKPILQQNSTAFDFSIPNQEARALFARASDREYKAELNSERGRQTVAKAIRYNIPFDKNDIDFLGLMDEISEWEYLLERAEEFDIDWNESNYDFKALEQEIHIVSDDPERVVKNENDEHRRDYYASIRLY